MQLSKSQPIIHLHLLGNSLGNVDSSSETGDTHVGWIGFDGSAAFATGDKPRGTGWDNGLHRREDLLFI